MSMPLLATKHHIPAFSNNLVRRPHLLKQLNEGAQRRLTLISAPAGFGKTTLAAEWIAGYKKPAAWLSLDEGDNDCSRFLAYFASAMQQVAPVTGIGPAGTIQSFQQVPVESLLASLLNEIADYHDNISLVLDDYHVIDSKQVDHALAFLLEHMPDNLHLVVISRMDPDIPLARLRAREQLIELRAADLRFTSAEATGFLNRVMGLYLSEDDVEFLETRTEGWIAGLKLAALSIRNQEDISGFIRSFKGSHRYVLDYLLEEVLVQQSEMIQDFLIGTSILDRLCGPLCEAVMCSSPGSGQEMLQYLERANLFIIPLDNERHWYRYHHLFAELLKQYLSNGIVPYGKSRTVNAVEYHVRASDWYEKNGYELEAFHHAREAGDIGLAESLLEGGGMPFYYRGAMTPAIQWLESLPKTTMDSRPSLWVKHGTALMLSGHPSEVEDKLSAAEAALVGKEADVRTRDLVGQIAAQRALIAASRNQIDIVIAQSNLALEYLAPENLSARTSATLTLGVAYQLKGDRASAARELKEVISVSNATGNYVFSIAAASSLGTVQEEENQIRAAAATYGNIVRMVGNPSDWLNSEAFFGLARISYEWNDLDTAWRYAEQCIQVSSRIECCTNIFCETLLARIMLARGDEDGASALLTKTAVIFRQDGSVDRLPEIDAEQVRILLHQGDLSEAERIANEGSYSACQARVYLARGDSSSALAILNPLLKQTEESGCPKELLKVTVLQAIAFYVHGEKEKAALCIMDALKIGEPEGFTRIFADEGEIMAGLLSEAAQYGIMKKYIAKLITVIRKESRNKRSISCLSASNQTTDQLSSRELELLRLIGQGLSNQEIGKRLFLALSTVKSYNKILFDKLQVHSRTEALVRAHELGIL